MLLCLINASICAKSLISLHGKNALPTKYSDMFRFFAATLLVLVFFGFKGVSQHPSVLEMQNEGRIGITAAIEPGHTGMMVPLWLTNRSVIAPVISFSYLQNKELDLTLGVATRHYLNIDEMSYYFGFRIGSMLLIPYGEEEVDNDIRTDLFAGANIGLEYYLAEKWSVGLEIQGNFLQSDETSMRFENPGGMGFKLVPVLMTTFYF